MSPLQPSGKQEKGAGPVDSRSSAHPRLQTLPFDAVRITGEFWSQQQEQNRSISLRHGYDMLHKAGNFHNLRLAAGLATIEKDGSLRGRNFYDEDTYKWLEALGWEIGRNQGQAVDDLREMAEEAIALIVAAQMSDGYLNSYYQVVEPEARWIDLDHGHEMYCAGHLIQAAVAFQRALGDTRLLAVATRLADHMDSTFGPGKRQGTCGHPIIEMALVELYRSTNEPRYLALSNFLVDQRGKGIMRGHDGLGAEYHQDHVPVREASEVVGHAVRQVYLLAGVADLYLEEGDQALLAASNRLWRDAVEQKMYVTGGLGSQFAGEAFGKPYELPSDTCYCETCAAIGAFQWNWRMLLATGDARFAAIMEQTLYNGILVSRSVDGKHFFYANPLQLHGGGEVHLSSNPEDGVAVISGRPEWHYVACCPPNVMRLLASLGSYMATRDTTGVQIHHYANASLYLDEDARAPLRLKIETEYPWEGEVRISVEESGDQPWTLRLRVPTWAREYTLRVNGERVKAKNKAGYLQLNRTWTAGDVVQFWLPMPAFFVAPHHRINAVRGCVAVQRGPVIFALEQADLPEGMTVENIVINVRKEYNSYWQDDLLGGVVTVEAQIAPIDTEVWEGALYQPLSEIRRAGEFKAVRLIPYFRWGNRGLDGMRVWLPR